ncbi:MAG: hypothetical protein NE330_07185 [Lentisphaeraceae bacterium]|nr:hypothetical protein [Lentisphaeraceae bacterium]
MADKKKKTTSKFLKSARLFAKSKSTTKKSLVKKTTTKKATPKKTTTKAAPKRTTKKTTAKATPKKTTKKTTAKKPTAKTAPKRTTKKTTAKATPKKTTKKTTAKASSSSIIANLAGAKKIIGGRTFERPKIARPSFGINPKVFENFQPHVAKLKEAAPLLLKPMRLEYRVFEGMRRITKLNDSIIKRETKATDQILKKDTKANRSRYKNVKAAQLASSLKKPISKSAYTFRKGKEIWFRWYMDNAFSENGIPTVTEEEKALVNQFFDKIGSKQWWDTEDENVSAAWQALATTVEPERALHLLRNNGKEVENSGDDRIGRITNLPSSVELFGMIGSKLVSLGRGRTIPKNGSNKRSEVSYFFESLEPGKWMVDFDQAVDLGMGIKITDQEKVDQALDASWIIAVGISNTKASEEMETLIKDQVANGNLEIVPQDTPTNNSPGSTPFLKDHGKESVKYLKNAAQKERGDIEKDTTESASELLAEALDIDESITNEISGAADTAFEDAKAMLKVIGPALLDDVLDGKTFIKDASENDIIDVMAEIISARGILPVLRAGKNAYGIATVTNSREFEPHSKATDKEKSILDIFRAYAVVGQAFGAVHADRVTPRILPSDEKASSKIETILKANRMSNRLDVAKVGSSRTEAVGCPYISGSKDNTKPAAYLEKLRSTALPFLDDPTDSDNSWPLLYRLARVSLEKNTLGIMSKPKTKTFKTKTRTSSARTFSTLSRTNKSKLRSEFDLSKKFSSTSFATINPSVATGITSNIVSLLQKANRDFSDALLRLKQIANSDEGNAKLEALLLEVFDLFQHRIDAIATGLAYHRLKKNRENGQKGLSGGYYGFIGKLRETSVNEGNDGFILAPSVSQAASAAIMRSAYLRHNESGSFAINLRSERVRRGLAILDFLKKGISLSEALGLRGERWLHDNNQDKYIALLRFAFPLKNSNEDKETSRRCFDGLMFLDEFSKPEAKLKPLKNRLKNVLQFADAFAKIKTDLKPLLDKLEDDLDSVSDIIMAEAVHQRALGDSAKANAWLQILSGGHVPGNPIFIKTQRHGQGSSHRLTIALDEKPVDESSGLREIAEPSIAGFAASVLGSLKNSIIEVSLKASEGKSKAKLTFDLSKDLSMTPIDLVIGGKSEIELRLQHQIYESLSSKAQSETITAGALLAGELKITINYKSSQKPVNQLLQKAEKIRKVIQNSRYLEPRDICASSLAELNLTEEKEFLLVKGSVRKLRERAQLLKNKLTFLRKKLATQKQSYIHRAEVFRKAVNTSRSPEVQSQRFSKMESERKQLVSLFWDLSFYAEPALVRPLSIADTLANIKGSENYMAKIESRLVKKEDHLDLALNSTKVISDLENAKSGMIELISGIQFCLDGEALPILPPFERINELKPVVGKAETVNAALAEWSQVRVGLKPAVDISSQISNFKAFTTTDRATIDPADEDTEEEFKDIRSESEAPKSRHFGIFVGSSKAVKDSQTVVGLVVDDWSEQRPSETQMAGLAINYDTPQAEAPNCLLLCVPPNENQKLWSNKDAAEMVHETIQLMKVRAISSDDKLTPAALYPNANQVSTKAVNSKPNNRIPIQKILFTQLPWIMGNGSFMEVNSTAVKTALEVLKQKNGFTKIKE